MLRLPIKYRVLILRRHLLFRWHLGLPPLELARARGLLAAQGAVDGGDDGVDEFEAVPLAALSGWGEAPGGFPGGVSARIFGEERIRAPVGWGGLGAVKGGRGRRVEYQRRPPRRGREGLKGPNMEKWVLRQLMIWKRSDADAARGVYWRSCRASAENYHGFLIGLASHPLLISTFATFMIMILICALGIERNRIPSMKTLCIQKSMFFGLASPLYVYQVIQTPPMF